MKPVLQTEFGSVGNCYSACLASLLEIDISEVPNFYGSTPSAQEGSDKADAWLADRGLRVSIYDWPLNGTLESVVEGGIYIFSGRSPRLDVCHAVIGKVFNGEYCLLHDPHHDAHGLVGNPLYIDVLYPLEGSK